MKIDPKFSAVIAVLLLLIILGPMMVDSCNSTPINNASKIKGLKFSDLDRDGKYDANDPGVPGVTIKLINVTNGSVVSQTTTNAKGYYEFNNLLPGDYIVKEILLIGTVNTTPSIVPVTLGEKQLVSVCFGNSPLVAPSASVCPSPSPTASPSPSLSPIPSISPSPSPTASPTPTCTISPSVSPTPTPSPTGLIKGIKFYDTNMNGTYDPDEPRIAGVTILLYSGLEIIGQATTNGNGYYQFTGLTPGEYVVREVVPPGYYNTTPASVTVTLNGQNATAMFGNVYLD